MRRVLLTLFTLFVALTLGALWYASNRGFTRKWRQHVMDEFHKRGVEVTLRRLTLDPLRGIVAKDVRVYDAVDKRRTLAVIDEMVLQVNFSNLIRSKPFIDALDLHDANLSLPVNPEKPRGQKIEITGLNGRLFLPPQQIYLAYADANVLGLHVSASGRLIHPQAFLLSGNSGEALSPALVTRVVDEIKAIKFDGGAPVVSLTFSGDLAQPSQIFAELAFWAERIRKDRYALKTLYVGASFRGGILDLKQLVATDAAGELRISGWWDLAAQHAQWQLRSSIDAASLARACGEFPWLDDFVFYASPAISLRLDQAFGEKPAFLVTGEVNAGKFAYRSVVFDHAESGFSWDGRQWSLRDVRVNRGNGEELRGDALQVAGDFRARLSGTLNPRTLQPLLADRAADIVRQFDFSQPPRLSLDARGLSPALDALRVDGEASVGPAVFRGVPAEGVEATLHYENGVLSAAPFHLKRTEGEGTGSVFYDFRRDEIRFDKVCARVNPLELAMWIDPNLVSSVLPYRFVRQAPDLRIDGLVDMKSGATTRLAIDLDAPEGLDCTFLGKEINFSKAGGKLLFTGDRLKISDVSGAIFGGSVSGNAEVSLVRNHPGFQASAAVSDVDFASLTNLYFGTGGSSGPVSGHGEFSGSGEDVRAVEGHGQLTVTRGNVFAIPFLTPFSGILDGVPSGPGRDPCRRMSAGFTLAGGAVVTNDLIVQGRGFSLLGDGQFSLLDGHADFNLKFNPQGLPGLLLSPLEQLLEFSTNGQFSKPQWQLRFVPAPSPH